MIKKSYKTEYNIKLLKTCRIQVYQKAYALVKMNSPICSTIVRKNFNT